MSDKLYDLRTEQRGDYLYARLETESTGLELMVAYGNELAAAVRQSGCNKILFENHAPILYDRTKYAVASSLFRNLVSGPLKVAIVDMVHNDKTYLGEATASAKAAGFDAKYFSSVESAEGWLQQS